MSYFLIEQHSYFAGIGSEKPKSGNGNRTTEMFFMLGQKIKVLCILMIKCYLLFMVVHSCFCLSSSRAPFHPPPTVHYLLWQNFDLLYFQPGLVHPSLGNLVVPCSGRSSHWCRSQCGHPMGIVHYSPELLGSGDSPASASRIASWDYRCTSLLPASGRIFIGFARIDPFGQYIFCQVAP